MCICISQGAIMTLTVRLDRTLESALERYCADRGLTKSLVAQEALAAYLVERGAAVGSAALGAPAAASLNHAAFCRAGVLGSVVLAEGRPARSADKAAVRERLMARAASGHRAQRPGPDTV
jgi:hypothetical protein